MQIMTDDVLQNLFSRLKLEVTNHEDFSETVKMLHEFIMGVSNEDIVKRVSEESLEFLITLTTAAKEPEALFNCEDVVGKVLQSIPTEILFKRFSAQFLFALNSNSSAVKTKFLQVMRKSIEKETSALDDMLAGNSPILISVCRCISDPESEPAAEAHKFLVLVAKRPNGLNLLFKKTDLNVKALLELHACNESIRFRLYELVSDLSQLSASLFNECNNAGFITLLVKEMDVNDILIKLNVLEILTTMSINANHCLTYFYECGLLSKIYALLDDSQQNPDATFLFPAVIKFFGHLFRVDPARTDEKFPRFLQAVFHLVINYRLLEVSQRLLAFDSLGLVSSCPAGKSVLGKYNEIMKHCMRCFGECIREGPLELRARHLDALIYMFQLETQDLNDSTLLDLTEHWMDYARAGTIDEPVSFLFSILQKPIPEIRPVMCSLFKSLIVLPWARTKILNQQSFVDFITEPLSDRDPAFNMFRHELTGLILKAESSSLQEHLKQRLQIFYDNGPYYKGISRVDVAMESAT